MEKMKNNQGLLITIAATLLLMLYVLSYAPFYLVYYCTHTPQDGDWRPFLYAPLNWVCEKSPFFASLAGSYFEFFMENIHGDIVEKIELPDHP
jgi:hypothetical protein